MTTTITEFRCPTCGHILGEQEHRFVVQRVKQRDEARDEEVRHEMEKSIGEFN